MRNQMRAVLIGGMIMACCGTGALAQASPNGTDSAAQDKMFLMKSAEGSMAEIQMSQLALKKSKNDEVKQYAQKMVDDHTKLISDMKPFADQMGVTPPAKLNPSHMQEVARLKSMSGDKFDKEYITAMVGDHHKDLGEFQAEEAATSNQDLKSTVAQGEQVIKMHTEMIDGIAQKNGITTPPMPVSAM
jgi:putative membrane protein